jgi:extradiol dioxygenase family protein
MIQPFHVAVPVHDLEAARTFYTEVLGCKEGRSATQWIDFDLFGHQFVVHLKEDISSSFSNPVDGHGVPIPHYGVVLKWEDWESLSNHLKEASISFIIEPYIRFKGKTGEQATMFFKDPSGNALEFKAFKDISQLFAT